MELIIAGISTPVKGVIRRIARSPVSTSVKRVLGRLKDLVIGKREELEFSQQLKMGNELCRGRMVPMSPQLITIVKKIYTKVHSDQQKTTKSTPVMLASYYGYADMVWGFIQCSKQTHTDLHTQYWGGPKDFLWLQDSRGNTALDVAITSERWEVVKLLLSNATRENLELAWKSNGKILFPLLHDHPEHDGFIFDKLEQETTRAQHGLPPITFGKESVLLFYNQRKSRLFDKRRKNLEKLTVELLELNPKKNTLLHIVSKFGVVDRVEDVLRNNPTQLSLYNFEGETPVYVAAREGHVDVLQIMFTHLKRNHKSIESHVIRPKDKHSALHIAIQNHHAPVVFLLLEEVPQLANHENVSKQSPLYLAAERSYGEIVKLILKKCRDKTNFRGPNGKTALHAAAIANSAECVKYLLDERVDLLNEIDENEWTPLHYVVHHNSFLAMEVLLNVDHSIGFKILTQNDTVTSALHIAASGGHIETMKVLLNICLGSSEYIDSKGRNILHVAIENKQTAVIELIFQDESLTSLINEKDNNGNTPAHLLAKWNFEMMQKLIDSRVDIHSLNKENRTPLDMLALDEDRKKLIKAIATHANMSKKISSSSHEISMIEKVYEKELEGRQKKAEAHFKMVDNLVLVVTLITTATFAAAFTVPGGFHSDNGSKQGTPYLLRKSAFQAFVVTNAIAFSCSASVLLAHIWLLIDRNRYDEATETEQKYIDGRIVFMYYLTGVALIAMLVAFVTGFYVVLLPSLWLAILVCALSIFIVAYSLCPRGIEL